MLGGFVCFVLADRGYRVWMSEVLLCTEILLFFYPFILFVWRTTASIPKGKCKELGLDDSTDGVISRHPPVWGRCEQPVVCIWAPPAAAGLEGASWSHCEVAQNYDANLFLLHVCLPLPECDPPKPALKSSPSSFDKNGVTELNVTKFGGYRSFVCNEIKWKLIYLRWCLCFGY